MHLQTSKTKSTGIAKVTCESHHCEWGYADTQTENAFLLFTKLDSGMCNNDAQHSSGQAEGLCHSVVITDRKQHNQQS